MIFSKSDLVFYQGFTLFYSHKYEYARKYFQKALELKLEEKGENQSLEEESLRQIIFVDEENEEEELVIGQTFTKIETIYNIALCYLLEGNYQKAIEQFENMTIVDPANLIYQEEFEELLKCSLQPSVRQLIDILATKKIPESLLSNREMDLADSENNLDIMNTANSHLDQPLEIAIFPFNNRLCGIYQSIPHELEASSDGKVQAIALRLSFCLPYIAPPNMSIRAGFETLEKINIECVENRPEAPWIRRSADGIIFTNNILEKEAYLVGDVGELLEQIEETDKAVVNTRVKLNAEKIFEEIRKKEKEDEEKKKSK